MADVKFVYGIRSDEAIKIGVSTNPESRLSSLQTGNAEKLWIAFLAGPFPKSDAERYERSLHDCLEDYRLEGEWFRQECQLHPEFQRFFNYVEAPSYRIEDESECIPVYMINPNMFRYMSDEELRRLDRSQMTSLQLTALDREHIRRLEVTQPDRERTLDEGDSDLKAWLVFGAVGLLVLGIVVVGVLWGVSQVVKVLGSVGFPEMNLEGDVGMALPVGFLGTVILGIVAFKNQNPAVLLFLGIFGLIFIAGCYAAVLA